MKVRSSQDYDDRHCIWNGHQYRTLLTCDLLSTDGVPEILVQDGDVVVGMVNY